MLKASRLVAMSALALTSAWLSTGCTLCPCKAGPGAARAAGATSGDSSGPAGTVAYAWKNVTILGGGFVTGVIFSQAEKDLIYARTDIGGAYRWNPSDQTWSALTDQLPRADANFWGIESLAADPVDPGRVYLAVGTYTQSWAGNGAILRSKDRGDNWERTDMPIKMGGNENGRSNGERLAIDPNQNSIVLFGSRKNGLWKSEDAGKTWDKAPSSPVTEEPLGVGITFVLFDAKSGAKGKPTPTIYAGIADTKAGLYRSTDAGKTFKPVPKQPTGVMPSHGAFDPSGVLYLSYGNLPGPSDVVTGAVWKYDPKKDTWTNVSPLAPSGNDKFGYGGLTVDRSRPGTVMVTTIDRWTMGDEIFRTTDGGSKWTALGAQAVRDAAGAKYLWWDHDKPSATGWMGDIDLDPFHPGRAMYVTGQGIWHTDDATQADSGQATHWVFRDRGLEETVVHDLVSPPAGPPLLSAVGDLCGFRHDDLNQPSAAGMFKNPLCGNGSSLDFAEKKPDFLVRSGVGGNDQTHRGAYSVDGGKSWTPFATEPQGCKGGGVVGVSADGVTVVWACRGAKLAYSRDQGKTWAAAGGLPAPSETPDWAPVSLRAVADRVNPKKFYGYEMTAGQLFVSTDGGANFVAAGAGVSSLADYQLTPASIQAVPGVEGDVWVTTGKELYRSTDSGKSYGMLRSVSESYGVGFGKPPAGKTFPAVYLIGKVGEVVGVFRSDDAGETWLRINDDRQQFGSSTLIIGDPRVFGRAYVGTPGRGIFFGDPK